MKRPVTLIILMLALFCLGFVIQGGMKAALMKEIADGGMRLVTDTTETNDFDAKLYEFAYSLPVASEPVGLWLEAVLARKFETFSANGKAISPGLAKRLAGWPLNKTVEIDLSNSATGDEAMAKFGGLKSVEWVDLSGSKVTGKAVIDLVKSTPNLRRLELKNTGIEWSSDVVGSLLQCASLKDIQIDEGALDPMVLTQLRSGLNDR